MVFNPIHRFHRVLDQIDKDLLQLPTMAEDER
jgi:hypothetical protein